MSARMIQGLRLAAVGASIIGILATAVPVAAHVVDHAAGHSRPASVTLSSTGAGTSVIGFQAPGAFDPTAGYPATTPPGSTPRDESFAGLIHATSNTTPPVELTMYCIDLTTSTWIGLSYEPGSWGESSVPNVGLVARILNDYFPTTGAPVAAANDGLRAAAVQAAIWFLTDRYVLDPADPVHDLTAGIVTAVLAAGVLPEPALPLSIAGPTNATAGQAAGPFAITTTATNVVVHVTGGSLFSDATATTPVADGDTIPASTHLWLVGHPPGSATISIDAAIVAPSGHVMLYAAANPANPDPVVAQKLILAGDAPVRSSTSTTIDVRAAATPGPTPSGGVGAESNAPTPPPTDQAADAGSSSSMLQVVALLAVIALTVLLFQRRLRT